MSPVRLRRASLLLLLLGLAAATACTPIRRGGGGDDDDDSASDDDDDAAGDDDDGAHFEPAGELTLTSDPSGTVTLPALYGVVYDEVIGRQVLIVAGAAVDCEGFGEYGAIQTGAYADYVQGEIDLETYIALLYGALLDLVGASSWAVLVQVDTVSDAGDPIPLAVGDWERPESVSAGRMASSPDVTDILSEGGTLGPGSFPWSGTIDAFDPESGVEGSFTTTIEDWGGDFGDVVIEVEVSAGACIVEIGG